MNRKETLFTPEFKADALDRIENWQSRQNEKPAWTGLVWPGPKASTDTRYDIPHTNDGSIVIRFEYKLRRKDFVAAASRHSRLKESIEAFQDALSTFGIVFAEDDLSLFDGNDKVNRYHFHTKMLDLVAEPEDSTLSRIAFVSERLQLITETPVAGLLLQTANGTVFKVLNDGTGPYKIASLYHQSNSNYLSGSSARSPRRLHDTAREHQAFAPRNIPHVPEKINVLADGRFTKFIAGPVAHWRLSTDLTQLAVILTDMAAQGIKAAQLIDKKGISHTLGNLCQLTTIKKAKAFLHESLGWPRFTAVRELPAPQIVHRFIVIDRRIVADTPLIAKIGPGIMSEVTYHSETGKTTTTIKSVAARDISQNIIPWVNEVIDELPAKQTAAIIDVGLSDGGPNLVAIHDIFDQEWFAADHAAIITRLSEVQKKHFDGGDLKARPRPSNVLSVLRALGDHDEDIP